MAGNSPYFGENDRLIWEYIRRKPRREQFPYGDAGISAFNAAMAEYADMLGKVARSTGLTLSSLPKYVSSEDQ